MLVMEVVCQLHALLAGGRGGRGAPWAVVDDLASARRGDAPVVGVRHPDVVAHGVDHVLDGGRVNLGRVQDLHRRVGVGLAKVARRNVEKTSNE